MRRFWIWLVSSLILAHEAAPLWAGFADTPGKGVFVLDVALQNPRSRYRFDDGGQRRNLADDIVMYDPAGNRLGTISAPARHHDRVLLTQLIYGITEDWTVAVIVPYFMRTETELNLAWKPGAYAADLGRPYSEEDFWQFAESMGQRKPPDFKARNRLGDIILGGVASFAKTATYQTAALFFASTRTGTQADPEVLGATGTTGFELQSNGDVGLHLLGDYALVGRYGEGGPRLSLGGEVFYEWFFPRRFKTAKGRLNPLMLNEGLYAGDTYLVIPGDWLGGSLGLQWTMIQGTDSPSWITAKNPQLQKTLPPLLSVQPIVKYIRFFGNRYRSDSPFFDRRQNQLHPNGFRVTARLKAALNLLRYGVPLSLYYEYADQELIPGRSFFPIVNHIYGLQLYAAF